MTGRPRQGIAALLERMEQVKPGLLSPEDDAAWRAALRAQKESEKTQFLQEPEELRTRTPLTIVGG